MIDGPGAKSGSTPLTYGSGSGSRRQIGRTKKGKRAAGDMRVERGREGWGGGEPCQFEGQSLSFFI
jgi:hypothetical protein